MSPKRIAFVIMLLFGVAATPALALDVYLNGVRITGVRNQEFENATVTLDAQGNVQIKAPQYRVERADTTDGGPAGTKSSRTTSSSSPATTPVKTTQVAASPSGGSKTDTPPPGGGSGLSKRYWLVAQVNGPGMVQYRIEVRVNGRLVRSFTDSDAPPPVEITQYMRPGRNAVSITADKTHGGSRQSTSSRHWVRVVVADGHIEGAAVVIDTPGVIFTRNAAQNERVSREYTLNGE